jgi:uncharacterized protein
MIEQYYAGPAPKGIGDNQSIADGITSGFGFIFIMGKFFMIFSFLFGLSFQIQFSKSNGDTNFLLRFTWRLLLLFAIGFLHHLHYRGDILTIYAVLGLALLLFYRLPDKALLIMSLMLILNIPALATRSVQIFFPSSDSIFNQDQAVLQTYFDTIKSGSYFNILKANLAEFDGKMEFQLSSGRLYITLGLFLLGIYAGRKRFFDTLPQHLPFVRSAVKYSLWAIGGCFLFGVAFFAGAQALQIKLNDQANWAVGGFLYDIFNASLATLYVAGIIFLFQKEKWQTRLMILYPVGRMGLTTYLMQAMFGTLIFFSYGLGLAFELGAFYSMLLGLLIIIFQIAFAHVWFSYFNYGPVEWIWRNLTYFKIYPLRVNKPQPVTNP